MIFGLITNFFMIRQVFNSLEISSIKEFSNLLELSGVFEDDYFNQSLAKLEKEDENIKLSQNKNINSNNYTKIFNGDRKLFLDWLIGVTQEKFFCRKRNQERWESTIPWVNEENMEAVHRNLEKLAFTDEKAFKKKKYMDAVVFGALYSTMEDRFLFLLKRLDRIKTKRITFLTGIDRAVNFSPEIAECKTKSCLDALLMSQDRRNEQRVYYEYMLKKYHIGYDTSSNNAAIDSEFSAISDGNAMNGYGATDNTTNSLAAKNSNELYEEDGDDGETALEAVKETIGESEFVKLFQEKILEGKVTEKTMAEILLEKYRNDLAKYGNMEVRLLETKTKRPGASRANTEDTVKTLLETDAIDNFKDYVFISNQPHVETQKLAVLRAFVEYYNLEKIPTGKLSEALTHLNIEAVGPGNKLEKNRISIMLHMQTFAGTMYMRNLLNNYGQDN